jgi:DNA (cytosine-5)-methyltransferase 1
MAAYYNEIDPFAAQWLRNLIAKNLIAPGDVDERSIRDVKPDDLRNYTQCHFFAGIGVWSYALRRAGWTDDLPVWTGSCPCQPFSAAGKQEGTADARHLWPEWFRLICERRPVVIFGEQVAAAIRHGWLDLVSADLEGLDYAIGSAVMGAHSVGAPHIRQRLYFVADATATSAARQREHGRSSEGSEERSLRFAGGHSGVSKLADPNGRDARAEGLQRSGEHGQQSQDGGAGGLEHLESDGREQRRAESGGRGAAGGCGEGGMEHAAGEQVGIPGRARESRSANGVVGDPSTTYHRKPAYNLFFRRENQSTACFSERTILNGGFWSACDWLPCIDGKARPVEPGTFPLAHGAPARVGRLRAYGNAINAETAAAFIEAYLGR